jgi:ribosomal protein S27E
MFSKSFNGWVLPSSQSQKIKCPKCGKTTEHIVAVIPKGPQLGIGLIPVFGKRRYALVCLGCRNETKQLTKDQANSFVINSGKR